LGEENKKCPNEGSGSRPRGDNHKNANMGDVIEKSSRESLSQISSDFT
jgi:hypothetical protein